MAELEKIYERLNSIEVTQGVLGNKMDNLHAKLNSMADSMEEDITRHEETIYGNSHPGLVTKITEVDKVSEEIRNHTIADRWLFGIIITLLMSNIGWTVFHH